MGTDEPLGDDAVRLRYEFAVVPGPLLPRFMVRIFSLIQPGMLWQRGTILRYSPGPEGDCTELFSEYKQLQVSLIPRSSPILVG